jgi:phage I-like protein
VNGHLISNSKFEPPSDGWVQVLSAGEWPNADAGITQVCDGEAMKAIASDFADQAKQENWPGMLLDYDHFSHQKDKPSGAAGWIDQIEQRGEDLWAHVRFSESGEKAVRGGEYRLISPVLSGFVEVSGDRKRPTKLVRLALTNDPNIKGMEPVSNRAGEQKPKKERDMEYKDTLVELLGLNREATDEDIEKAIADVTTEAENRAKQAEEEALNAASAAEVKEDEEDESEAMNRGNEELVGQFNKRIQELEKELADVHASRFDPMLGEDKEAKAALRELCVMNRGAVVKVLGAVAPKPAKVEKVEAKPVIAPLFNRRVQPLPPAAHGEQGGQGDPEAVRIEAQKLFAANRCNGMTYSQAWKMAQKSNKVPTNGAD